MCIDTAQASFKGYWRRVATPPPGSANENRSVFSVNSTPLTNVTTGVPKKSALLERVLPKFELREMRKNYVNCELTSMKDQRAQAKIFSASILLYTELYPTK